MANDFLGQILTSVLGNARTGGQQSPTGGGLGDLLGGLMGGGAAQARGNSGGLGDLLGGLIGGGTGQGGSVPRDLGGMGGLGRLEGTGQSGSGMGNKGSALMLMLLPLAMQWVQSNGGISAVLQRFQHKGYSRQAASWVSTGANEELQPQAVSDVVGTDELSRLSQQLGVSQAEVSSGMAQILPEMMNKLTPEGGVPDDGDEVLNRGKSMLEQMLNSAQHR